MGSGKKVTIGYKYYLGIHMGISRGPVNEIVAINAGGKEAWAGSATASSRIAIDRPSLFGGDKKEGGIKGRLDVMMGESTQTAPVELVTMLGSNVPGFRGMLTLYYDGLVAAMNPYLKPWKFRVRRSTAGWDGGAWYAAKAMVPLADGAIHAMNPAHIIYEVLTNRDWGGGNDRSRLHDASFVAAADKLYAEGFGLCLRWTRQGTITEFVQQILDHIGGNLYQSRFDGLFHLTLIRNDYTPATLPIFDEDTGLLGIDEDENAASVGAVNEVVVKWHDPIKNQERSWRERNLAGINADRQILSQTVEYPGIPTAELAGRVAVRELRQSSGGVKRFKVRLDRRGYRIEPGDVFRIKSLRRGINDIVVRAGRIEDGTLAESTITITAIQDVFGLPASSMAAVQPFGWVEPDRTPAAATNRRLVERTWRDIAQTADAANLALIDPTACYVAAIASKPTTMSLGYTLQTRVGTAEYADREEGSFAPSGAAVTAIGLTDTAFALGSGSDLDLVAVGTAALIDDEIVRVVTWDAATLTGTIGRGCVDTVPSAHAAGAQVLFYEDSYAADPGAYAPTTTVQARLLTNTSQGILDPALAPIDSLTTTQRQNRPYPPGKLTINGVAYPTAIDDLDGVLAVAWAHRDRKLQADQLIDTEQASIGPESGTTYNLRIYNHGTGALLQNQTGITTTSASPALPAGSYNVRLELESVRGGLTSWQKHSHAFAFNYAQGFLVTETAGDFLVTEPGGDFLVLES